MHMVARAVVDWTSFVGFDVRPQARAKSISKRAPSTARTSLRLESITYSIAGRTFWRRL